MTREIRWGILATGLIADLFARDLLRSGHRIAAVGSRTREAAGRFAARFGIARVHGTYEALVTDPAVDIVYVATPHPLHAANAIAALEAGKHVLVEKPFTLNADEAERVVELATQRRLVVLEAMWTRFLPHMQRIRDMIRAGRIGQVRSVVADHMQDLPDDPAHRLNALELGGGALLDLGIYPISLAWDLLGAPLDIQAIARFKPTGADAQVATIFRHANEAQSLTLSASDSAGPNVAVIVGSEGTIQIDSIWYKPTRFTVRDSLGAITDEFKSTVDGRGMQYQAAEAERLIREGSLAGDILPPAQSVAIMRTLDAIRAQIGLKYPGEP